MNLKDEKGFSLAEMLVVVSILAILGIIFTEIFIRSLRGNYKAQTINKIKQEGQTVLNILGDQIKGADRVVSCDKDNDTHQDAILLVKGSDYARYYFQTETDTKNGYIAVQNSKSSFTNLTTQQLEAICVDATALYNTDIDVVSVDFADPQYLTDTNTMTGVSVKKIDNNSDFVNAANQAGFNDTVEIKFNLGSGVNAPNMIIGQIDPIPFVTTIGLR